MVHRASGLTIFTRMTSIPWSGVGAPAHADCHANTKQHRFSEALGRWAFWLYNRGLALWILLNFFPIGWAQLDAVYAHGLAYARSQQFYDMTLF